MGRSTDTGALTHWNLEVHILPCPDLLQWSNKTCLFAKHLHRLSTLYLVILVPLLQLLNNLCKTVNVISKWFLQLHMTGVGST